VVGTPGGTTEGLGGAGHNEWFGHNPIVLLGPGSAL
jgi:hypothetical protein